MIRPLSAPPSRRLHQQALDLLFPPRCVGCRRPGAWICAKCWPHVPWLVAGECIRCREPVSAGRLCGPCVRSAPLSEPTSPHPYAAMRYDNIGRQAVRTLKYSRHTDIATVMGPIMAGIIPDWDDPLLVPVPLHWTTRLQRGFNQAELLAKSIATTKGWSISKGELIRGRRTKDQVELGLAGRGENVAGAFRWQGGAIKRRVLLIDDVYTTGSTLNSCARTLREAGATTVEAGVFAVRTIGQGNGTAPTAEWQQ